MIKIDDVKSIKEVMIFKLSGEVLLRTVGSDINSIQIKDETSSIIINYKSGSTSLFMNVTAMITEYSSVSVDTDPDINNICGSNETRQKINV